MKPGSGIPGFFYFKTTLALIVISSVKMNLYFSIELHINHIINHIFNPALIHFKTKYNYHRLISLRNCNICWNKNLM